MRIEYKISAWLAVAVLGLIFLSNPPDSSERWAAWVQAFGSIGAIYGASLIARNQVVHARKLEDEKTKRSEVQKIEAIYALLGRAQAVCLIIEEGIGRGDLSEIGNGDCDQIIDAKVAIDRLPFFEIPNVKLVTYVALVPRTLAMLEVRLRESVELHGVLAAPHMQLLMTRLAQTKKMVSDGKEACIEAIRSLH